MKTNEEGTIKVFETDKIVEMSKNIKLEPKPHGEY